MPGKQNASVLKVWLYPEHEQWVRKRAKELDCTLSQVVRQLIEAEKGGKK